mgnify:CR=1 FL=1
MQRTFLLIYWLVIHSPTFSQNLNNYLHYVETNNPRPIYPYIQKSTDASIRFQNLFYETLVDNNKQNNAYESRHINIESSQLNGNQFIAEFVKSWRWNDDSGPVRINDIKYSIEIAYNFGVFSPIKINKFKVDGKNIILELGGENNLSNKSDIIDKMRHVYVVPSGSKKYISNFEKHPSGTGPFAWETSKGTIINLESSLGDWSPLGAPNIDRIIIEEIPLVMNHWQNMQAFGEINLLIESTYVSKQAAQAPGSDYKLKPFASDQVSFLLFNCNKSIFQDRDIRKGIDLSIQKDTLAQITLRNEADVISGPFSSQSPYYDPTVHRDKANIIDARKLLANSLTKVGNYFEYNGKPVSLRLIYDKNVKDEEADAIDQIRTDLQELGFKVTVKALLTPTYRAYLKQGSFDIAYYKHQYGRRSFAHTLFASKRLLKQRGYIDLNYGNFNEKGVDGIIDIWSKTEDRVSKYVYGKQLHKRLNDEVAAIFLFSQKSYAIHHKSVSPIIVPYYFFGRPHEWKISNN